MCSVCGCGPTHHHSHDGADDHHHHAVDLLHVEQDILSRNNIFAEANRRRINAAGAFAINLVSSPGSGKTTLLTTTIDRIKSDSSVAVIEGDQQTSIDAERIRQTGVNAIQINTGKGCHLDGHMVSHALDSLKLEQKGILFIENVGNLVCPASFDLGENHKVAILSVTEGDDKPLKYPDMFAAADLMIISKIDLLPHVDFDVARCSDHARAINPEIMIFCLSARTGEGMGEWLDWLLTASRKSGMAAQGTELAHA
jgi:hydrogenase nickel incorporation protein HypB